MRKSLEQSFDFSTYACFTAIVNSEPNSIDRTRILESALGKYLVKNGYYATERELVAILRRLDQDCDGKVLYGDLSEYIKPRQLPRMQLEKDYISPVRNASQEEKPISPSRYQA